MASQKDQIQALITEIDDVLQKASPRLPWVMSGDTAHQRRVLERVRNFLVTLQKRLAMGEPVGQPETPPNLLAYDIYYQQPPASSPQAAEPTVSPQEMTAQQMLQMVMQEMGYLRTGMMQSMQAEMESLRQEREVLVQEVRQLEAQRRGYSPTLHLDQQQQLGEFLQVLMGRLQEALPQQVAQSLQGLPAGQLGAIAPSPQPTQAHSDQLLVNLDTTIRIVFESLQRDIKAYQDSLAQGLDRMHTLGQQGEMMFSALVTHLAEKLGQGASSYIQVSGQPSSEAAIPLHDSSVQTTDSTAGLSLIADPSTPSSATPTSEVPLDNQAASSVGFPYAGAEILPLADLSEQTPPSSVDAAIDSWLDSVAASINETSAEPDLTSLDMPDLDFAELDLTAFTPEEIGGFLESEIIPPADLASQAPQFPLVGAPSSHEDSTNIDVALKLLEQLSAQPEAAQDLEMGTSEPPVVVRTDLDEFYDSLFGPGAVTPQSPLEAPVPSLEATSPSDPTLGWNLIPEQASSMIPQFPSEFSEPPGELISPSDPTLGWDLISEVGAVQASATLDHESFGLPSEEIFQEPLATDLELDFQVDDDFSSDLEELSFEPEDVIKQEDTISALSDLIETDSAGGLAPLGVEMGASPSGSLIEAASLFIDETSAAFFQASSPLGMDLTTASTEGYILASPEENLLPTNESFHEPVSGLWLDEATLSNLDADLSNLENSFGGKPLASAEVETDFSELYLGSASESEPITPSVAAVETPAEPVPILEDWADSSLDDFAAAIPQTVVPETGTDALASAVGSDALIDFPTDDEDAFTLEGIGDLFVDVPSTTPSFSPESQPTVSGQDLLQGGAQGGAGLSEDSPFAFSLEGMDDLFADAPPVSASPIPPPIAPPATEPPAFTLEGMDDLFAEAPSIAATPVPPPASPSLPVDQPPTFTLEGMNDLFADVPTTDPAPLPSSEPLAELTLGGMDDLFADLPATESSISEPVSVAVGQPAPFFLEEVGGVFSEKPLNVGSAVPDQPGTFALEQQHGLFVEVPLPTSQPQSLETDPEKKTGLS